MFTGLQVYTVIRSEKCTSDTNQPIYRYAIKQVCDQGEGLGMLALVSLSGVSGQTDPLRNIRNVELLIGTNNEIKAINIDGDCVVERNTITSASSSTG